jgi:hypothetical protein
MMATCSMSSSSVALLACLVIVAATVAPANATVTCPQTWRDHNASFSFSRASVFEGDPRELADLIPVHGEWDLSQYGSNRGPFFLVCRYEGTDHTISIRLPREIQICKQGSQAKRISASCD